MDNRFSMQYVSIDILHRNGVDLAKTSDVTLLLMLDGQAQLGIDGQKKLFNQDDMVIINAGTAYSLTKIMERSNILVGRFVLSSSYLMKVAGEKNISFICDSREDSQEKDYGETRVLMKKIIRDYAVNGLAEASLMQISDLLKLLHLITSHFMIIEDRNPEKDQDRTREIQFFLEQNYDQAIGLSDVADHLGLTEAYLARCMKKYFGTTLINYLYDIRLAHAREDLVSSRKSLTRVSFDNGFPNLTAFDKRFAEKYGSTPAMYRKHFQHPEEDEKPSHPGVSKEAHDKLMDYFETGMIPLSRVNPDNLTEVVCDAEDYSAYTPLWNVAINIGPAEALLRSDVQQSVLHAHTRLEFKYGRIWSIFSPDMYIVNSGEKSGGASKFNRLFRVLDFLLGTNVKPIIELGEKRNWIRKTVSSNVRESRNETMFRDYAHFLSTLDEMMEALVAKYRRHELSTWAFEIWDDKRIEVYSDKRDYITIFRDVQGIIRKYVPKATLGGAGNYIGWSNTHTEESIRRWIDTNTFPDYLTFTYSPYRVQEKDERFSTLKADEDDLAHTIDGLHRIMKKYGYPVFSNIYINKFNMTDSSRNYFNDSLWKAGYMAKAYLSNIGKVAGLLYSQLSDTTTDYYDDQRLLNGSGGLLTRDLIEKPAFLTLTLMKHLFGNLVAKGEDYILTRDEYGNFSLLCFNFISRNYLYYLQEEDKNTLEDHYSYFEHQEKKTFHFRIENVPDDQLFTLHHHVVNRQAGSIMDEWARFDFLDNLPIMDIAYLRQVCIPKLYYTRVASKDGKLEFDLVLEPLEIRCVTIRRK